MKGLFFSKPLEFRLETPAEQLAQGDEIAGSLSVVNRGGGETLTGLQVGLAHALLKDIKSGADHPFNEMAREVLAPPTPLKPGEERKADWKFSLPGDCPITSKEGTLFLLYGGDLNQPGQWTKLDLQVAPCMEIQGLITTLENRMKCGLGKCGRCNVGNVYVCKDGPVFTAAQVKAMPQEF